MILDELSMVSLRNALHVLTTINELTVRPVVLDTGDPQQVQPIQNNENRVEQVPNTFGENKFYSLVYSYRLRNSTVFWMRNIIDYLSIFVTVHFS
jgi:hypothetical protein